MTLSSPLIVVVSCIHIYFVCGGCYSWPRATRMLHLDFMRHYVSKGQVHHSMGKKSMTKFAKMGL